MNIDFMNPVLWIIGAAWVGLIVYHIVLIMKDYRRQKRELAASAKKAADGQHVEEHY